MLALHKRPSLKTNKWKGKIYCNSLILYFKIQTSKFIVVALPLSFCTLIWIILEKSAICLVLSNSLTKQFKGARVHFGSHFGDLVILREGRFVKTTPFYSQSQNRKWSMITLSLYTLYWAHFISLIYCWTTNCAVSWLK